MSTSSRRRAAEGLERALRVVAAAVEAPVDSSLDSGPHGTEERGDGERGDGDGQVRASAERREHLLEAEHDPEVGAGEERRDRAVDDRPVDDPVELVEAVAEDGDPGRDGDGGD